MLITTNQVVTQWGTVFGDEVLAAAILDRLLHHSHTLMIQGESYRLRQKKKAGSWQREALTKSRLWTLPEPWMHRTRPPLLGKPPRTGFPTATTALIFINQEGVSSSVGRGSKNPVA